MSNDVLGNFKNKKLANSPFLTLQDGESANVVNLKEIKPMTKAGYGGEEKDILRLTCVVQTSEGEKEKIFDNGTLKFVTELEEKGVVPGMAFTLTRVGVQTKTRYMISNVRKAGTELDPLSQALQ